MNQVTTAVQPETSTHKNPNGVLQRRCACGAHTAGGGMCTECRKKQTPLQRKLMIGASDDPLELEADRIADQVMAGVASSIGGDAAPTVQRFTSQSAWKIGPAPDSVEHVLASPGRPLERGLREDMEMRFGYDFSHVRVHTDAAAERSVRDLNAHAYTSGHDIVFAAGRFAPSSHQGQRLLAHELTHVVQQSGAHGNRIGQGNGGRHLTGISGSGLIQRAGDPAAIPPGLPCPTDLTAGRPAGTDIPFPVGGSAITRTNTTLLEGVRTAWLAAGGTDDIIVHGYASTDGDQGPNWTLSCDRAMAVQAELIRLGIPAVRISVLAHGESTDFGTTAAPNRHAVVGTRAAGPVPLPLVGGTLTARDNFAGRGATRFGVGEVIDLNFFSLPTRPAADFGGLQWFLLSGGGTLVPGPAPNDGTATYTAPAVGSAVQLELRVATGATAGRVISAHAVTVVIPSGVRITEVPGTAPNFSPGGAIPAGSFGAGFLGNVFVDPMDVSFQGVVFGEGTVASVITPVGSFMSFTAGVHPANTFGPGHGGNAATGTPVSPPSDQIFSGSSAPVGTVPILGVPFCGASDFLWAIPWEFSVAGGPRTPFAGGFTANHHATSDFFCNATIEKAGAGPFCRRINGTTC